MGVKHCWFVWYEHLQPVLDKVAEGLQMEAGKVRAYELSLLQNDGLVANQSLHHDCTTPEGLPDAETSEDQEMQEEDADSDDREWSTISPSQLVKHRRG